MQRCQEVRANPTTAYRMRPAELIASSVICPAGGVCQRQPLVRTQTAIVFAGGAPLGSGRSSVSKRFGTPSSSNVKIYRKLTFIRDP